MNIDEAKQIAAIIASADGGCSHCVRDLAKKMNKSFPDFLFAVNEDVDYQDYDQRVTVSARVV